jgi:RNA polymerase sigma-70 factor (ECF subfamily)
VNPARARSDADLIQAARSGDQGALQRLLERHLDRLWRLARVETLDDAEARTLLEGALRALPARLSRANDRMDAGRWLLRELYAHARNQAPRPVHALEADADPTLEALSRLEPELRRVIALRDVEGLSYADIAEVLGLAKPTVASRVHHARQVLAAAWEADA